MAGRRDPTAGAGRCRHAAHAPQAATQPPALLPRPPSVPPQALYFCRPFREQVLAYAARLAAAAAASGGGKGPPPENMLTCLAELFLQARGERRVCFCAARRTLAAQSRTARARCPACCPAALSSLLRAAWAGRRRAVCAPPAASQRAAARLLAPRAPAPPPRHHHLAQVSSQRRKCGFISPRRFVGRVKQENALFSSYMHQVGAGLWGAGAEVMGWGGWGAGSRRARCSAPICTRWAGLWGAGRVGARRLLGSMPRCRACASCRCGLPCRAHHPFFFVF